jgi:hypothetical protein
MYFLCLMSIVNKHLEYIFDGMLQNMYMYVYVPTIAAKSQNTLPQKS